MNHKYLISDENKTYRFVKMNYGWFPRRALIFFSLFWKIYSTKKKSVFCERFTTPYRKRAWFTPLQSSTKAAACWLGANTASNVFWFLTEKQNCTKESLAPCLVSAPFRKREDLSFQSHIQPQLHCLLTVVGVQNLAAPSIMAKWIH